RDGSPVQLSNTIHAGVELITDRLILNIMPNILCQDYTRVYTGTSVPPVELACSQKVGNPRAATAGLNRPPDKEHWVGSACFDLQPHGDLPVVIQKFVRGCPGRQSSVAIETHRGDSAFQYSN